MKIRNRVIVTTLVADLVSLVVAGAVASVVVFDTVLPWDALLLPGQNPRPFLALIPVGLLAGSWVSARLVQQAVPRPSYARAVTTLLIALGTVSIGTFALRTYYSGRYTAYILGLWFVGAVVHRAVRRRRPWVQPMVLVTAEKQLAHDLDEAPHARVLDVLEPRGEPPNGPVGGGDVVLALDFRSVLSDAMARFVSSSTLAGVEIAPLTQVYEEHTGRVAIIHLAEGWEISTPLAKRAAYAPFKRGLELFLVVITAPLWLVLGSLVWAAIRLDSRGPAIFRQERVGLVDRPFTLYKFRTMADGADDDGPQFTSIDDPRITRVGRFLRKTRLDEIPQLWNVLRGDMALVGPRAEQVGFVAEFEQQIPFYRYRHLVRPGITGWAQVHFGYAEGLADTIEKLTYDLYYVRHMSPGLDLSILWNSAWTVLSGKGAR